MQKHIYAVILFTTIFCLKGFAQAFPPTINSYADSAGADYADLYITFSPNDTGNIKVQIQLQHSTGNNLFDSTYTLPATDSGYAAFHLAPLTPCLSYDVLINMKNAHVQGTVINPLLTFTTLCTAGIAALNENNYSVIARMYSIEIHTADIPQNGNIEIYDITGRQVINTGLNQSVQQIPFNQNAGIYLLRITGNGQSLYTNRFVIN